jgi:hypothetical protein
MRKLPVFKSAGEVFSGVTRHYFQLLIAAWPAIILLAIAAGLTVWVSDHLAVSGLAGGMPNASDAEKRQAIEAFFSPENDLKLGAALILYILASAIAAVRWHRFVLFGEGSGASFGRVRPLRHEDGTYIWTIIRISLIVIAAVLLMGAIFISTGRLAGPRGLGPLNLVVIPIALIAYGWAVGAYLRLMLALPDAALGLGGRIKFIFGASAGNAWRLFGLFLMIGLLVMIAFTILGVVFGQFALLIQRMGWANSPLMTAIGTAAYAAIYLYFLMAQITMLSVAYREIIGLPAAPAPEPDVQPA